MKATLITILFFSLVSNSMYAQKKPTDVYFIVDTASSPYKVTHIVREGGGVFLYLHCKCLKDRNIYPIFRYSIRQAANEKHNKLPNLNYLSWAELTDLIHKTQHEFDQEYSLNIVEKMPDGTYVKNRIKYFFIEELVTH